MYDFQEQTYQQSYFNSYRKSLTTDNRFLIYYQIKRTLFFILMILIFILSTLFIVNQYKKNTHETKIEKSIKSKLTNAVASSIIKNLQAQKEIHSVNDEDLKYIVSKVIHKIETFPTKIIYTTQQGE